jgi:hypothetical protein
MIKQVYSDDPHQTIAGTNHLAAEDGSVDLESTLQFTTTTGSAYFDFSTYCSVGENVPVEKQKILDEVNAFKALRKAVDDQFGDFLTKATKALEILDGKA